MKFLQKFRNRQIGFLPFFGGFRPSVPSRAAFQIQICSKQINRQFFHPYAKIKSFREQEAQSHCDIFRQRGAELIDGTYNKCFSIETLSEEFKPVASCLFFFFCFFFYYLYFMINLYYTCASSVLSRKSFREF